jgi:hypothetical protein
MNRPTMAPVYVGVTSPNREPRGLIDYFHARTNTTEVCLSCGGSNITSSNSSSSAKMNGTITEFKWNNTIP